MRLIMKNMGVRGKSEQGQVAILFALVFTFMFILFAFVVDFGHLINTKINLQLAADSAAYAGAAWQARTLNKIGMVNYRIRQDLKELAMRTQVTHLRHNRNFPRGTQFIDGQDDVPQTEPFVCQQAHGYQSLSGVQYAPDTNLCRNASPSTGGLPPIVVPPVIATFDPFAVAIAAQIRRIQQASNQECRAAAQDNEKLARHLVAVYTERSRKHGEQVQALAEFLNGIVGEPALTSNHPIVRVARESALKNRALAAQDDFTMEILQPNGGKFLDLEERRLAATLFYVNFNVVGDGCVGRAGTLDFNNMIAGYEKVQSTLTYFAVKLTARPRMLFMPGPWTDELFPQIVAFAAAKPFGSRIGPKLDHDQLAPVGGKIGNQNRMINFSFIPDDTLGIMSTKRMALFDALHPFNGVGRSDGTRERGRPRPDQGHPAFPALALIRTPTKFDAMMYTIYPDPDVQEDYLEPQYAEALYPDYLEPGHAQAARQPATQAYLSLNGSTQGAGWVSSVMANTGLGADYEEESEEGEESHVVTSANQVGPVSGRAAEFGFATRDDIHSGWSPRETGRIGYSVKLVPFIGILQEMKAVDSNAGRTNLTNLPSGDPNINRILH